MKYSIMILLVSGSAFGMEPKKIVIPRVEVKRIVLKRSGFSIRSNLCDLANPVAMQSNTQRVIDRAMHEMKMIEIENRERLMLNGIRDFGQ